MARTGIVLYSLVGCLLRIYPCSVAFVSLLGCVEDRSDVRIGETSTLTPFLDVNCIRANFNEGV